MRMGLIGIAVAALLPASAVAADPPRAPIAGEHRLSDAEVQKVLDAAALRREAQAASVPQPETQKPLARPVEGEVGVAIGTGGYREAFGTAVLPIGQDGVAIISFDNVESNRGHSRRRR